MKFVVKDRMRPLLIIGCGLLATLLASCDPASKYSAEIESIDSCLVELDSLEDKHTQIDYDSLKYMVSHIVENESVMKALYEPDTILMEFGRKMNECKGVRKSLNGAEKSKELYTLEIDQLKTQFINLKNDIENGVLKDEQLKEYLAIEKSDLADLKLSFNTFYEVQENQKKFFYRASPAIDEMVTQLKNEAEVQ